MTDALHDGSTLQCYSHQSTCNSSSVDSYILCKNGLVALCATQHVTLATVSAALTVAATTARATERYSSTRLQSPVH
eukprot:4607-Heterococcus_DN1.PRE.1